MYIATTDGALRMGHLANFMKEEGLARDPEPVPTALPAELAAALALAGRLAALDEVRWWWCVCGGGGVVQSMINRQETLGHALERVTSKGLGV